MFYQNLYQHQILDLLSEGEKITVKNVGEKITDPLTNKSRKEIFANSWIYNTSSRFKIKSIYRK